MHQSEVCGQVSVVDEGTILFQEGVKTGNGQLSKTLLSHDRKEELCDSCDRLRKQVWKLELRLEKYRDECVHTWSTQQRRRGKGVTPRDIPHAHRHAFTHVHTPVNMCKHLHSCTHIAHARGHMHTTCTHKCTHK